MKNLKKIRMSENRSKGQFEGKFLLAMPNMGSNFFDRSLIYVCAHSDDGAMGFCVNKVGKITVGELIARSELKSGGNHEGSDLKALSRLVRDGGPVDKHRGFVIHSKEYVSEATVGVSPEVSITSSVQILAKMNKGAGPERAIVSLGYSGWGAGQLEAEMLDNAWLVLDADPDVIFSDDQERKYENTLETFGIDPANIVADAGHA